MTSRPTFGDFAQAVSRHLESPAGSSQAAVRRRPGEVAAEVVEYAGELQRIVKIMGNYLADLAPAAPPKSPWRPAAIDATYAVRNAAGSLAIPRRIAPAGGNAALTSSLARDLRAASTAMTAGRDLLNTHFTTTIAGERRNHSEWAPLITASPVRSAILTELARWARQVTARGAHLTGREARLRPELVPEQAGIIAACTHLTQMASAIEKAQSERPIHGSSIRKLYAVPANILQPRRLPAQAETVTALCQGTIDTAERVRQAATQAIPEAALSPSANADSFTHTASSATVISRNCATLQRILATRAAELGNAALSKRLTTSANLSETASQAWLATVRAWDRIRTDTEGEIAPAAAEASDLTLWTGRLTYTDPNWIPGIGAGSDRRQPADLAPEPSDVGTMLSAVHQASYTLTTVAAADYAQIRTTAQTGRLFIPVIPLDRSRDQQQAYIHAPADRVTALLDSYRDAGTASVKATVAIAELNTGLRRRKERSAKRQPSTPQVRSDPELDLIGQRRQALLLEPNPSRRAGPVESTLRELGVTSQQLLARSSALDVATRNLVAEAIDQTAPERWHAAAARLTESADTAQLIEDVLLSSTQRDASGTRTRAFLARPQPQGDKESAQAEP